MTLSSQFQAEKINNYIVKWLLDYATNAKVKGFIVGISGGIDSALTSTLCAQTGLPTLCVEMPIHQAESHVNRANEHINQLKNRFLNVFNERVDLTPVFETFKNQVPTDYFSPKKFNAVEIFADFLKDENSAEVKSIFYNANAASGFQFIEDGDKQWTYRIQAKLGYRFSDRMLANVYGLRSNIASATAAGFTYNEFGFRLKWLLFSKPVFQTIKD